MQLTINMSNAEVLEAIICSYPMDGHTESVLQGSIGEAIKDAQELEDVEQELEDAKTIVAAFIAFSEKVLSGDKYGDFNKTMREDLTELIDDAQQSNN